MECFGQMCSRQSVWVRTSHVCFMLGRFLLNGHKRRSLAFQVLAISLALWGVLMGVGQLQNPVIEIFGNASRLFGPVPQMLSASRW